MTGFSACDGTYPVDQHPTLHPRVGNSSLIVDGRLAWIHFHGPEGLNLQLQVLARDSIDANDAKCLY